MPRQNGTVPSVQQKPALFAIHGEHIHGGADWRLSFSTSGTVVRDGTSM